MQGFRLIREVQEHYYKKNKLGIWGFGKEMQNKVLFSDIYMTSYQRHLRI